MINDRQEPAGEAAFNSAVATLMRLDRILTDIKQISLHIGFKYSQGVGQRIKYRLTKDFLIQSTPLIKSEEKKSELKSKFYSIKLKISDQSQSIYSSEVERQLDDVLIQIQESLQEAGYFMPEKIDSGL